MILEGSPVEKERLESQAKITPDFRARIKFEYSLSLASSLEQYDYCYFIIFELKKQEMRWRVLCPGVRHYSDILFTNEETEA